MIRCWIGRPGVIFCFVFSFFFPPYIAAMKLPLPQSDFRWLRQDEIDHLDPLLDVTEKGGGTTGYIFEVDLSYPSELHLEHSSFPLAPHQQDINEKMLSEYAFSALKELTKKTKYKSRKLTSTFLTRRNYVVHGICLKLYLQLGMKLLKIHRVMSFKQDNFIRPYVNMCTQKRASAPTKTRKDLYKVSLLIRRLCIQFILPIIYISVAVQCTVR